MHATGTLRLGCTDCHGGNADARVAAGVAATSPEYEQAKRQAHPQPRDPKLADRSANPERVYTQWLKESPEYVRFVNPGDLRVAPETCGRAGCHPSEVRNVSTSMMTTGGMLWGAALYNNGGYPHKDTRFGESYARDGTPQTVRTIPQPSAEETRTKGVLPEITPLERWEISQPGNVLRVFERGGGPKGEVGEPVARRRRGQTRRQAQHARIRHAAAHRSGFSRPAENAPARSAAFPAGHERSAGRLSRQRLHGVPRGLCERSLAGAFRAVCAIRQSRLQRDERSDDSARRIRPPHPPRIHALDPVEPVHGLPRPSGHEHDDHLFRLHLVGQRIRRRRDVSESSSTIPPRKKNSRCRSAIPKARRRAGCGPT